MVHLCSGKHSGRRKADERTTKKYIEKIKNYKGLDFFKVQALVNEFIKEIEK